MNSSSLYGTEFCHYFHGEVSVFSQNYLPVWVSQEKKELTSLHKSSPLTWDYLTHGHTSGQFAERKIRIC